MPKTYLQLAKGGDVVSILPCLHADFKETGEKPHLIISNRYAHVLEGLDYLEPVIWTGDWGDIAGALREAKLKYREVLVPQMHGKDYVPRRQYPSFQLDQWHRSGRLKDWGKLPLVYPRSHGTPDSKYILLGDHSESSKFAHIEDLHLSLVAEFPHHRIVRLSSVRLPLLADLVALYDGADLIVTIDTLHAHLSAASSTPVIVLATDSPSKWHGTAFHPRMAAHIRYGDYEMKKSQLMHAAKQCVNKSSVPWVVKEETKQAYGYNLSVLTVGDKLWKTYRYHPGKSWRTDLMLMRDGEEIPIKPPSQYISHSIEDGRLFTFADKPHISCTIARSRLPGETSDRCVTGYGELTPSGLILNWKEPKYKNNQFDGQTKNLVFFQA